MAATPVSYAEQTLGVHEVWTEAQSRLEQHKDAVDRQAHLHSALRTLRATMTDQEMQVAAEGRAKYSELSATAFGPVLKGLINDDPDHRALRDTERGLQSQLDQVGAEIEHHSKGLHVLTARMNELGGLLEFYAAAKRTTTSP